MRILTRAAGLLMGLLLTLPAAGQYQFGDLQLSTLNGNIGGGYTGSFGDRPPIRYRQMGLRPCPASTSIQVFSRLTQRRITISREPIPTIVRWAIPAEWPCRARSFLEVISPDLWTTRATTTATEHLRYRDRQTSPLTEKPIISDCGGRRFCRACPMCPSFSPRDTASLPFTGPTPPAIPRSEARG